MERTIFSADFKPSPFWWERTPRPRTGGESLPVRADVVIIGSGYTGLSAAIETAGRGLDTLVVDAHDLGWGCSSRNGGQISTSIKSDFHVLAKRYGEQQGRAILREGHAALDWLEAFIARRRIDCDFRRVGRFYAAHNRKAFAGLKARLAAQPAEFAAGTTLVEPENQQQEIGSALYHGGAVFPRHASLDPGRYHHGLLALARAAGVQLVSHCRVADLDERNGAITATTERGVVRAGRVIVATSGYTGRATPWLRRRIIPIGSYVIATEPLAPGLAARLIPNNRVVTDTRRLVVYYRLCPNGQRMIFGGRVALRETDPRQSAPALRREMIKRFPALADTKISHSWMGFVGYTFDELPHVGRRGNIFYAMGYCGSGVSLASYFGMRVGQQAAGVASGATALDGLGFPGRFYYHGNPWFLAPSIFYYRWRDALGSGGAS